MFRSLRASLMAIVVPGVAAALLISVLAWTSYGTLDDTARKTFVAKDVVADILPPPMYLIEMRLLLSQAIEGSVKPDEARRTFDRLVKEYDARVAYWKENPPYGLEEKLLGAQHKEGLAFIAIARKEIIDRLVAGDAKGAQAALPAVHQAYLAHRVGVDNTVIAGNEFAATAATQFDTTGQHGRWTIVGVAALLLALLGVMSLLALRRIVASVQRGVVLATAVAAGDLTQNPPPTSNDEFGQLQAAMLRMQNVLRGLIQAQTDLAHEHTAAGKLSARIELDQFEGSYRTMAEGVNSMVASQVALTERIVDMVGEYGQGNFASTMEDLPGDKARVTSALRSVQDSLKASAERAASNLRVRHALDVADTNVMLVDAEDAVLYVNRSLAAMLERVEPDLRRAVPGFSAAQVIGSSASALLAGPDQPAGLLDGLTASRQMTLVRGARTFEMILTPIVDATGVRTGTAIEWNDVTDQLAASVAEKAALEEQLRSAAANLRIKTALDAAEANVMLAGADHKVLYVNQSMAQLLREVEADVRSVVPDFSAAAVIGSRADRLIESPEHPRQLLEQLRQSHKTTLQRGARTFNLILTPVFDTAGARSATALEWKDVTTELAARDTEQRALTEAKRLAAENLRIKNALDKCSTNVMIANAANEIVYMNESVAAMMLRNQDTLRQSLPNFDARKLLNQNVDLFHKNPSHQKNMLANLRSTYKTEIKVSGLTFGLVANPIVDDQGVRVGTVVEWNDRSAEVAVEQEMAQIVEAASAGNFEKRFELEGKDAFFRQLGTGINRLLDTTSAGLGDIVRVLGALAQGNLTQNIAAHYDGTFGTMKDDANVTVQQLAQIIGQIREATETIHTGAIEIASGNLNLSERTEQQASSLQQTAATLEQLTATVKQNADSARQANELAMTASTVAQKGGSVVSEVVTTMSSITASSNKIVDIISVIDGIAFQTNILALNAAVEAARAGEQGRGFAVVAGEVRNLAQRSAAAAKEIKTLIGDSVDKVDAGSKLVEAAGQTMQDIVASVSRVTSIMGEISSASVQQSSGIEQVNQAVSLMDQATQQNAALVEQAAAAAESMKEQASNLSRSVGIFTLAS